MRRTWAPTGETRILRQRTRSHQKVSAAGVVTISPGRRRLGLHVVLYPNANVTAPVLVDFLRALRRHVRGPLIFIWNRLSTHRARTTNAYLDRCPQIHTVLLPAYAPELNAIEYAWSYLKGGLLANHAPNDAPELTCTALRHVRTIASKQNLLRGFVHATGLSLRFG